MRHSAFLTAILLLLTGCVSAGPEPDDSPSFITPPVAPASVAEYYDQVLRWQDCRSGFECAYALAPLDWSNPNDNYIRLSLMRSNQADTEEALFVNPGGPGVSAVEWMSEYFDSIGTQKLRAAFDVVAWDPRGVGDSSAITCSDDQLKDQYLYSQPTGGLNSEADIAAAEKIFQALIDDCSLMTGELLTFVGTDQSARDLDLLRELLGQKKLNYLGYSYGTELGAKYLALFPENAGRVVLDGAVDPTLDNVQTAIAQAQGFERAFDNYLEDCLASSDCPFQGDIESAKAQVGQFLLEREESTLPTELGSRELGVWGALTGIFATLYSQDSWSLLTDAFRAAFDGDGSDFLYLADFYNDRFSDSGYSSNLIEANLAISCADEKPIAGKYDMDEINSQIRKLAPVFGRYFEASDMGCKGWPEVPELMEYEYSVNLDIPALVIGTTGDPATPYEQALALTNLLGDARLLSFEGEGHTAYPGSSCVNKVVDDYLIDQKIPSETTNCK